MALEYLKDLGKAQEDIKKIAESPVGEVLKNFATDTIQAFKDNLAASGRIATGALAQSMRFEVSQEEGVITLEVLANDYWDFINSGVDGVEQSAGAVENQFGGVYNFKTLNPSRRMLDAFTGTGSLRGWMAARGITALRYTDKNGNAVNKNLSSDSDFRQAAFVFARGVKRKGIKPSNFVNDVLTEEALDAFENAIADAFLSMIE